MTILALIFLALAMSTDAFAAALGKGAAMQKPRFLQALRIGLLFGCIEAITPIIGWLLGSFASKWISAWDHWLAFFLLLGLGGHMIWVGLHGDDDDDAPGEDGSKQGVLALALTAVATSIDAMAVGVGLAFINVNIFYAALAIGTATTVMVTIGVMLGRLLGAAIGKKAEIIGGVVLILVGATILYEHLGDEAALARAGKAAPQSQMHVVTMVS